MFEKGLLTAILLFDAGSVDMLICGQIYVMDFRDMTQRRKNGSGRIRRIRREADEEKTPPTEESGVSGWQASRKLVFKDRQVWSPNSIIFDRHCPKKVQLSRLRRTPGRILS